MEPISVTCTSPAPVTPSGPSPKSPLEDTPPSPNHTPPVDSEKTVAPTSERTASPEPNCAICLGKSQNKSFTDSCLHQFCFNCLLEWSKIKPECPLCKQSFKSIIHNVRSNEDYDQYHLRPEESAYPWINMINIDMVQQRFRYRSTLTPDRRMERALVHLEQDLQRRVEPGDIIPPQRTWRRRRGLAPDDFRVNVYNQNLWVSSLPCVGSGRDISPQNFRAHPEEVHRLIPWLNRELQAILRSPGLSARVLDLVITQLPRHHMHSPEFRFQLESYLRQHYDHFIHEFNTFARSPYDMIGFDENANYSARQNMVEEVHEVSSDSSDSDIVILPQEPTSSVTVASISPVPGPSRAPAVLPVDQASDSDINISNCPSDEAQASLSEVEDSDACVIVGYVKPRHERTPEIITLLSSDPEADGEDEDVDVEVLPPMTCVGCCDHSYQYSTPSSSASSSPESSGSEYAPSYVQQQQQQQKKKKKKVQRKKKSVSTSKPRGHAKRKPPTKSQPRRKQIYTSSDSSSECSCSGKKTVQRRRRAQSPSSCQSSSSDSDSSSSSDPTYKSRTSHTWHRSRTSSRRDKKGSWRIQINVPDMKQEYDPPYTSSEINDFLASGSSSNSRPKLRSIVITRATNGEGNYRESSGSSSRDKVGTKQRKTLTKSHREDSVSKKVKEEEPSTSTAHHRSSSHSSHSSHRRAGTSKDSSRRKHTKKDNKKKSKRRKESESSPERKSHSTKAKKRKRVLTLYSDSSDN